MVMPAPTFNRNSFAVMTLDNNNIIYVSAYPTAVCAPATTCHDMSNGKSENMVDKHNIP